MTAGAPGPPRRFRRRLVAFTLMAGLLPLGAWGVVSEGALHGLLEISLSPIEQVMGEADAALGGSGSAAEVERVRGRLSGARLLVAQLELARRSLARLEPRLFWAALALTALVFGVLAVAVSRSFTGPIDQLTAGMAALARGELTHVIPGPGPGSGPGASSGPPRDELAYLVDRFNRMAAELLAQRERLRTTEQLAAWRDVARALAHELKNPLTAMRVSLARLSRAPAPDGERLSEPLALLDEEISVLMRMTQAFSEFARLPAAAPRALDVAAVAREVAALYGAIQVDAKEEARALADPDQLRRALGNLAKNAVEAAAGAEVRMEVWAEAGDVVVRVLDRGPGIGAVVEGAGLLAGLSSTKAGGSGLGLPIAHRIVAEHGGTLRLEPREGGGTVAMVRLPRAVEGGAP